MKCPLCNQPFLEAVTLGKTDAKWIIFKAKPSCKCFFPDNGNTLGAKE